MIRHSLLFFTCEFFEFFPAESAAGQVRLVAFVKWLEPDYTGWLVPFAAVAMRDVAAASFFFFFFFYRARP